MTILFPIFLIGFTAMAAQIVIIARVSDCFLRKTRFLLVLSLAVGFIWGAVGSWFLGKLAEKTEAKLDLFLSCQLVLSLLLVLSILAIRSIKFNFRLAPGETAGVIPMIISSFVIVAPICMPF